MGEWSIERRGPRSGPSIKAVPPWSHRAATGARDQMHKRLLSLVMLAFAVSCSPARSVESFCTTFRDETESFVTKYEGRRAELSESDESFFSALSAASTSVEMLHDLEALTEKLEEVAPDSIRASVANVHDALEDQIEAVRDAVGDPFGALGSGVISGLMAAGSWERIETFTERNCPGVLGG